MTNLAQLQYLNKGRETLKVEQNLKEIYII